MRGGSWTAALAVLVGVLLVSSAQGKRTLLAGAPAVAPATSAAPAPAAAGAAAPATAPAAGPAASAAQGQATITSVLDARAGTFTDATHLFLAGVSKSVAWVFFDGGAGGRATDRVPISNFTGKSFIRNGAWLDTPDAVVHATNQSSGNDTTLVLSLSEPVYNASAKTLTFTVAPKAAGARPKLVGGAAEDALASSGPVRVPEAGLVLTDVTLFIDDSSPPSDSRGTKASFGPLSGQLVDMRPRDQQNSRFAGVNNGGGGFNGGGGLINAGSARWGGWGYPWGGFWG